MRDESLINDHNSAGILS